MKIKLSADPILFVRIGLALVFLVNSFSAFFAPQEFVADISQLDNKTR